MYTLWLLCNDHNIFDQMIEKKNLKIDHQLFLPSPTPSTKQKSIVAHGSFKMRDSSLYHCFLFRPVAKSLHDIRVRRVGSLLGSLTLKGPQTVRERRAYGTMGCAKYHFSSLGSERKGSLARDQRHLPVRSSRPTEVLVSIFFHAAAMLAAFFPPITGPRRFRAVISAS